MHKESAENLKVGMCITDDEELKERIKLLRHHGENPKYIHRWVGLNSRLDTLQAAILLVKLSYLNKWSLKRKENAAYYFENLIDIPEIKLPFTIQNLFTFRNVLLI